MTLRYFLIAAVAVGISGCTNLGASSVVSDQRVSDRNGEPNRTIIRAALYEWIPGYEIDQLKALRSSIEKRFEALHPEYDLQLNSTPNRDDLYDLNKLEEWLGDPSSEGFDVLEIDTLLLGELAETKVIASWSKFDEGAFFKASLRASRVDGEYYGMPHLMCGYFLFTREPELASAESAAEVIRILSEDTDDSVDLVGGYSGSWTMPALYLDAVIDTYEHKDPTVAWMEATESVDQSVVDTLKSLFDLCQTNGVNGCLSDRRYSLTNASGFSGPFALGFADGLVGYSERFHYIAQGPDASSVKVRSATLGAGNRPLMFADAFVISSGCANHAQCRIGAEAFVAFMNDEDVLTDYLLAEDLKTPWGDPLPPRYLLPALKGAYEFEGIANDPVYASFEEIQSRAVAFPNKGFEPKRKDVRDALICRMYGLSCNTSE